MSEEALVETRVAPSQSAIARTTTPTKRKVEEIKKPKHTNKSVLVVGFTGNLHRYKKLLPREAVYESSPKKALRMASSADLVIAFPASDESVALCEAIKDSGGNLMVFTDCRKVRANYKGSTLSMGKLPEVLQNTFG